MEESLSYTGENLNDTDKKYLAKIEDEIETTKEIYLNILDRLCYIILSRKMSGIDWKEEYGRLIKGTYKSFTVDINKKYDNIKKVYMLFEDKQKENKELKFLVKYKNKEIKFKLKL